MSEFQVPIDVVNRGLQHCGAPQIDAVAGFTEQSNRARQCAAAYGKLRRAELQRNAWVFAIRPVALRPIDITTMRLAPSLWVSSATYFVGSIVADSANNLWISRIQNNLGNPPTSVSGTTTQPYWEPYFGPLTVTLYDATQTYFSRELVYTTPGDGTYRVFLSLISANADNPATATAWDPTVTYSKNQVVTFNSIAYMSLVNLNINQEPDLAPALFNIATTYAAGNKVGASDGVIYQSVGSGNVGHDPVTDGGVHWTNTGVLNPWTTVFTGGTGSLNWLEIGGAEFPNGAGLASLNITYPIGSGPSSQSVTQNVYLLPNGFLRRAPQDPKVGSISYLGAPGNAEYEDWVIRGSYITSAESAPIILYFIADVTDVVLFDDLFCECLAARIGMEVCEPLTQSTAKVAACRAAWQKAEADAITVNAILIGSEEAPLDDWLACRA